MATIRYIKDQEGNIFLPVTHERGVIDSNGVNLQTKLAGKQDSLVSGTNIKTINNTSILGSGNISISGGVGQQGEYGKQSYLVVFLFK